MDCRRLAPKFDARGKLTGILDPSLSTVLRGEDVVEKTKFSGCFISELKQWIHDDCHVLYSSEVNDIHARHQSLVTVTEQPGTAL
jgi:hypothetical protein